MFNIYIICIQEVLTHTHVPTDNIFTCSMNKQYVERGTTWENGLLDEVGQYNCDNHGETRDDFFNDA